MAVISCGTPPQKRFETSGVIESENQFNAETLNLKEASFCQNYGNQPQTLSDANTLRIV